MPKATADGGSSNVWEAQEAAESVAVEAEAVAPEPQVVPEAEPVEEEVAEGATGPDEVPEQATDGPKAAEVRAWARENGVEVSDRGVISDSVMALYAEAHKEQ